MPRKKIKIADKNMIGNQTEEEQKVEEVTPPAEKPKGILEEHFTLGNWKGHPNYSCKDCVWSGVEKVRAQDHYIGNHMRPLQSSPEGSKLYDRYGNKLVIKEE